MIYKFAENFNGAILGQNKAICEKKTVQCLRRNADGAATYTQTVMFAKTVKGVNAQKTIIIDDEQGETTEKIIAESSGKKYEFANCNLTGYRCAEMTVLAILMLYGRPRKIGFIGTGKTNLLNMIAITREFDIEQCVIRGSKRNLIKNIGDFFTVSDNVIVDTSDDMKLLNECEVVIECCNNCEKSELLTSDMLKSPKLIVALDCGFLLDETFRKDRVSFSDWPEQLEAHYKEEFVFDEHQYQFKQMRYDHEPYERAVVYLYGVAIADAVATERLIREVERNGMEKPFHIG